MALLTYCTRHATYLANNTVTLLGKCHNRWRCPSTFSIGDNCGLATLHSCYCTVGGPEIDSNNLQKSLGK